MDYQFLNDEIHTWMRYNDHNFKTIELFSDFTKTIASSGSSYYNKVSKSLNEFKEELSKTEITTSLNRSLWNISRIYEERLNQLKNDLTYWNNDIVNPISTYLTQAQKLNKETFKRFNEMNNCIQENKNKLEALKNSFLNSSKELICWEDKAEGVPVKKKKEQVQKLQTSVDAYKTKYKSELERINQHLESSEVVYDSVISIFQLEERKRFTMFKEVLDKIVSLIATRSKTWGNWTQSMESSTRTLNMNLDMTTYKNYFDYTYKEIEKRFMLETFFDYYSFIRNEESVVNPIAAFSEEKIKNIELESIIKEEILKQNSFLTNNNASPVSYNNNNKTQDGSDDTRPKNETLNKLIEFIWFSQSPVNVDDINDIIDKINNDLDFTREFINYWWYHYKKNIFVKISNIENLHHLCNLLIIIMTNTLTANQIFDLNFAIIFFAEKTIYINPENIFNKCYLCKLWSTNKIFMKKSFWKALIELKIFSVIDKKIYEELEQRYLSKKIESDNVLSKMKNLFKNSKMKDNQAIEMEMQYAQWYHELLPNVSVGIIENYIQHFSNFNYDVSDSIEWISDWSNKYKFSNDYLMYFVAEWNTNMFTIKNRTATLEDIEHEVDYHSKFFNSKFKKFLNYNDNKFNIIAYALKYLPLNDVRNIWCINKVYYSRLKLHVYKNILLKYHDMPMKDRLSIWKNILNYNEIKRDYDYKAIVEGIKAEKESTGRNIIELDVARTPMDKDVTENRQKILNILKALDRKCPEFSYSQGMNYMAAFILKLTGDEEEAFYFFCALLLSTEYGNWFKNHLAKLKMYFYTFDKLLNIYLPELYFYLKNNNINVSFFVSPWFITWFTNALQYINVKENPKVLLRIWDVFLWNGWKSILKIALSLVKHYETKLLTLTFEDILYFWINDIIKFEFFQNTNFGRLMFITINFKINWCLISNIENEFGLKNKIQMLVEKDKEKGKEKGKKNENKENENEKEKENGNEQKQMNGKKGEMRDEE